MRTRKLPHKRDANAGFTLLELTIVLAVIGILSAILIPSFTGIVQRASFTGIVQRAEETAARQNCRIFAQSYALYLAEDEGGLSFDGYIFVSGDFAYCVENGELVGSDYEAEDGALIGSDGEPRDARGKGGGHCDPGEFLFYKRRHRLPLQRTVPSANSILRGRQGDARLCLI